MKMPLRKIGLGILAAMLLNAGAYGYDQRLGSPVVGTTFTTAIQQLNLPVDADYLFGSSVSPATGQTAVTDASDLGNFFNPYEVNTGTITTNSEWERYQPFSSAANFVFNTNNLQLTGTLGTNGNATVTNSGFTVASGLSTGSTNTFTNADCQMANTTGVTVGQLFNQVFRGIYYVTSVNSTTITTLPLYGSSTSLSTSVPCIFPNAYFAITNAASLAGSTTISFAAVPAGVTVGNIIGLYSGGNKQSTTQQYNVTAVGSTSVTVSPALASGDAIASGQGVFFFPPILSGQIWSKATYNMPGQNGASYFAMELTAQLPQNAEPYGFVTSAPSNGAYGAWPAFWLRADTLGSHDAFSELDVFELYNHAFRNMSFFDTNVITAPMPGGGPPSIPQTADWVNFPPLWTITQGSYTAPPIYTYDSATDYSLAVHKYQLLFTPDKVFIFIDGQMIKSTPWHWTSPTSPQIAANLAIGSLQQGLGSNALYPINTSNFPETYNIYELKVWGK